jgi:O-antigen ligase
MQSASNLIGTPFSAATTLEPPVADINGTAPPAYRSYAHRPDPIPPATSKGRSFDNRWLIGIAGLLYAIAMNKFATRDPLSESTGVQGFIETGGIAGAFACVYAATVHAKRHYARSMAMVCFILFGIFTVASCWRSFNPTLSFVKGSLLLLTIATGYLASQAGMGERLLRAIYWSYTGLLVLGLLVGAALPHQYPLFDVDDYSGRTRLSLFATHPGVMGECCASLILLSALLRPRPHWISVAFLFAINILAGGKTSSALLILLLLFRFIWQASRWKSRRTLAIISAGMAAVLVVAVVVTSWSPQSDRTIARSTAKIYGNNVSVEAQSLDGRTVLWRGAIGLLSDAEVFGYGYDGSRELLLRIASWSGQSHNGFLEVALESGWIGALLFLLGVAGVIRACFQATREFRIAAMPLLAYILISAAVGSIFNSPINFGVLLMVLLLYQAKMHSDPIFDKWRELSNTPLEEAARLRSR